MNSFPIHGRVDYQRSFSNYGEVEFDITKCAENDSRISANPLAWGNAKSEIVILVFSKDCHKVGKILHHLDLLPIESDQDLTSVINNLISDTSGLFQLCITRTMHS
jgi:hypothetical protein